MRVNARYMSPIKVTSLLLGNNMKMSESENISAKWVFFFIVCPWSLMQILAWICNLHRVMQGVSHIQWVRLEVRFKNTKTYVLYKKYNYYVH